MKLRLLVLLASVILLGPARAAEDKKTYEIVLIDERIEFGSLSDSTTQGLSLLVRNFGDTELKCPDFVYNLELVWDGVMYKRQGPFGWGGRGTLNPKESWKAMVGLNDYTLPPKVLSPGKHTIAFRDEKTQSNTITIFIKKEKANKAPEDTARKLAAPRR